MIIKELLDNPLSWVALAFIVLIVLIWKPLSRELLKVLDGRSENIKAILDSALETKEKAQELLASYEKKQKEAEKKATEILKFAQEEAKYINIQSKQEIDSLIKRRTDSVQEKFEIRKKEFLENLYQKSNVIAIENIKNIITAGISEEDLEKVLNESIQSIVTQTKS